MPTSKPITQIGDEVREMTDAEYAQYQIDQQTAADLAAADAAKTTARLNALTKLGLTADEINAIFG
jgi:hypothetical protein